MVQEYEKRCSVLVVEWSPSENTSSSVHLFEIFRNLFSSSLFLENMNVNGVN